MRRARSAYVTSGSDTRNVSAWSVSKPGCTRWTRMKLLISRPAPASSATASASSATTNPLLTRRLRRPVIAPRPPSFRAPTSAPRVTWKAGILPNRRPVSIATSPANAATVASTRTSPRRGMPSGCRLTSASLPHQARSNPQMPPPSDSSTLSVSNCRISRPRPAPSAVRTASSLSRAAARASVRLATLMQAIKSTNPTAPRTSNSDIRSLANDPAVQRRDRDAADRRCAWGMTLEPPANVFDVGRRLRRRHAVFQTSDDVQIPGATIADAEVLIVQDRHPEHCRFGVRRTPAGATPTMVYGARPW